ncbi:hypothetical protein EDD86DRAFT_244988 [Gorgonomyces haynaldii]|nr:hypothetical protein EDD86DRAFT_244988 [Gorgonomyces haynaldii]
MDLNPNEDFYGQLKTLRSMGFTDLDMNRRVLRQVDGKLQLALEALTTGQIEQKTVKKQPSREIPLYAFPSLEPDQQAKVFTLAELGFQDEGKIRHALTKSKWNVEMAANLLAEDVGLESGFSGERFQRQLSSQQASSFTPPTVFPQSLGQQAFQQPPVRFQPPTQKPVRENPFADPSAQQSQLVAEFDPFSDSNRI